MPISLTSIQPVANKLGETQKDFPTETISGTKKLLSDYIPDQKTLADKYKNVLSEYKEIDKTLQVIFNILFSNFADSTNLKPLLNMVKKEQQLRYYISKFETSILHYDQTNILKSRIQIDKMISTLYLALISIVERQHAPIDKLFPYNNKGVDEFDFLIPDDQKYWLTKGAITTYYY